MNITHYVALDLHPIFIPLHHFFGVISDFGIWIADLLYRFALSFSINLIRRLPAPLPGRTVRASSSESGGSHSFFDFSLRTLWAL